MDIVGRHAQLARMESFIASVQSGPARLLLVGEAGIGKTTVWRAGVASAAGCGFRALTSAPAAAESSLAYAGLADLLRDVDDEMLDALPDPQRVALGVALLRMSPQGRAPDPRAVYTGLRTIVTRLAAARPVLLAVDDLQWLDAPSARALEFAGRRLDSYRVGILASVRPDPSGKHAGDWISDDERMPLEPLSISALDGLITQRLGAKLSRPTLLRLHGACRGNAFFAIEIARLLAENGAMDAGDAWPVPEHMRELIERYLRELPASAQEGLLRAAAASHPTVDLFGTAALKTAQDAQVLTTGADGSVRFAHPLYASAVYLSASPEERRAVHAELAEREHVVEERARHLGLAATGPDPVVAAELDRSALHAHVRGAPEAAAALQERALELTPAADHAARASRALVAAGHWYRAGSFRRARLLVDSVLSQHPERSERARALRLLAHIRFHEDSVPDAVALLHAAADVAGEVPELRAPVELDLAFASVSISFDFEAAGPHASRALAHARRLEDRPLLAQALAVKSIADCLIGRDIDQGAIAEALALERPDDDCPVELRPSLIAGHLALYKTRFAQARSHLYPLCRGLRERGQEAALPPALAVTTWLECWAGDLTSARGAAEEAVTAAELTGGEAARGHALALAAFVEAHAGREQACRDLVAAALAGTDRAGYGVPAIWSVTALALLELSLGDHPAAARAFAPLLDIFELRLPLEPIRAFFLPDAAEALIGVGQLERAARLVDHLGDRGRALDRTWALAASGRVNALLLAVRGELAAAAATIEAVLGQHEQLSMPLERARALLVKGQIARRAKRWADARSSLEGAVGLCEGIGADLWAERARQELERLYSGRKSQALTTTEERVATLAASGLTNREVAAALFISLKTVEANLSRVYRKLGIRSRAELGVRLMTADRTGSGVA